MRIGIIISAVFIFLLLSIFPINTDSRSVSSCMLRRAVLTSVQSCLRLVPSSSLRMMSTSSLPLPSLPTKSLTTLGESLQKKMAIDLKALETEIQTEDGQKDGFFKLSRNITVSSHEMLQLIRNGEVSEMDKLVEENKANILQVSISVTCVLPFEVVY